MSNFEQADNLIFLQVDEADKDCPDYATLPATSVSSTKEYPKYILQSGIEASEVTPRDIAQAIQTALGEL